MHQVPERAIARLVSLDSLESIRERWTSVGCLVAAVIVLSTSGLSQSESGLAPVAQDGSAEPQSGPDGLGSESVAPRLDELGLLRKALSDADPFVRGQAAVVLGRRGGPEYIREFEPLLLDSNADSWAYGMNGVFMLMGHYDYFSPGLQPAYSAVMASLEETALRIAREDGSWTKAGRAMSLLNRYPQLKPGTLKELRSIAAGRDNPAFLKALMILDVRGERVGDLVARAISIGVNRYDYRLARTLGSCQPRHIPEIQLLLESTDPQTLFLARAALERLGDPEADAGLGNLRALEIEKMGQFLNDVARRRLNHSSWHDVSRDRLLQRAHNARLVLFGEFHVGDGPLRDGQIELLRAFFRDSEHDALGFEPSVEDAQSSVIRAAQELGMQVFPLEENWVQLRSQRRTWERDNEVADRIHGFLDADAKNRMFVIRGESHITPGGYLVGQLHVQPMIVLSGLQPRWDASDGPPTMIRTSDAQIAGGEDVFVWALPEDERKEWKILVSWMQAQE